MHTRWSGPEAARAIPNAVTVTMLRDPVTQFESAWQVGPVVLTAGWTLNPAVQYYGLTGVTKQTLAQFAASPPRSTKRLFAGEIGQNQQLWDLGLDKWVSPCP